MSVSIDPHTGYSAIQQDGTDALVFNKYGLTTTPVTVRQTVENGPVDSSGFSAFVGATGSTTVTATGTLYATAAYAMLNLRGAITNPSWTGLSTNGTMYLYLDIAADGTCTTGSGTLAPVYQFGGTYSVTSGQFTFNIQEMTGKVGNGATAAQTYRVYVGEVTVAGNVTTAIVWYAVMGRYDSGYTATLPSAATNTIKNHNIGCEVFNKYFYCKNTTTDAGYAVGDVVSPLGYVGVAAGSGNVLATTNTTVTIVSGGSAPGFIISSKATGNGATLTNASWSYKVVISRGW